MAPFYWIHPKSNSVQPPITTVSWLFMFSLCEAPHWFAVQSLPFGYGTKSVLLGLLQVLILVFPDRVRVAMCFGPTGHFATQ